MDTVCLLTNLLYNLPCLYDAKPEAAHKQQHLLAFKSHDNVSVLLQLGPRLMSDHANMRGFFSLVFFFTGLKQQELCCLWKTCHVGYFLPQNWKWQMCLHIWGVRDVRWGDKLFSTVQRFPVKHLCNLFCERTSEISSAVIDLTGSVCVPLVSYWRGVWMRAFVLLSFFFNAFVPLQLADTVLTAGDSC